jgi:uncharacterized damage-inducible protein DinB
VNSASVEGLFKRNNHHKGTENTEDGTEKNPSFSEVLNRMKTIPKPEAGEYAPYTIMYIGLFPDDGLILEHLKNNLAITSDLLGSLSEEQLTYRYAAGKWTIKEILAHIIDDERIYSYRALRFARNDHTELPGFDQDEYTLYAGAGQRSIDDLLQEFITVRNATISLFDSLDDAALTRAGVASGNIMSVRAAAYHIAGHELHHVNIIKERYLPD